MITQSTRCGLALVMTCPCVVAQTTWIVDSANGPGTHFTDLPPAVQAAAPGDHVQLRVGNYTMPQRIDKPLFLFGVDWRVTGQVARLSGRGVIDNLPAGSQLTMLNLQVYNLPAPQGIIARSNRGHIHFENCIIGNVGTDPNWRLRFEDCELVTASRSFLYGSTVPIEIVRSNVSLVSSVISASDFHPLYPSAIADDAAYLEDSRLILLDSVLAGADARQNPSTCIWSTFATDGATLVRSTIVAADGSRVWAGRGRGGSCFTCIGARPVDGQGTLIVDPSVDVNCPSAVGWGVTVHQTLLTSARPGPAQVGGSVSVTVRAEPGSLAVLFADFARTSPMATPFGDVWIDPARALHLGFFPIGPNGTATSVHLLHAGLPTGLLLLFQAGAITPLGELRASLPGVVATSF